MIAKITKERVSNMTTLYRVELPRECRSPYHILYGEEGTLPLDIAVNTEDGSVEYIKFYVNENDVLQQPWKEIEMKTMKVPFLEFSCFSFDKRTFRENTTFRIEKNDSKMRIFFQGLLLKCKQKIAENVFIYFDDKDKIAGVEIHEVF